MTARNLIVLLRFPFVFALLLLVADWIDRQRDWRLEILFMMVCAGSSFLCRRVPAVSNKPRSGLYDFTWSVLLLALCVFVVVGMFIMWPTVSPGGDRLPDPEVLTAIWAVGSTLSLSADYLNQRGIAHE